MPCLFQRHKYKIDQEKHMKEIDPNLFYLKKENSIWVRSSRGLKYLYSDWLGTFGNNYALLNAQIALPSTENLGVTPHWDPPKHPVQIVMEYCAKKQMDCKVVVDDQKTSYG